MYCEDMDLCRRLADAGWQNVYVPDAVVTHTGGHATRRVARPMVLRAPPLALPLPGAAVRRPRLGAGPAAARGSGLTARALLALRVRRLGEGAAPTRSADLLEDAP